MHAYSNTHNYSSKYNFQIIHQFNLWMYLKCLRYDQWKDRCFGYAFLLCWATNWTRPLTFVSIRMCCFQNCSPVFLPNIKGQNKISSTRQLSGAVVSQHSWFEQTSYHCTEIDFSCKRMTKLIILYMTWHTLWQSQWRMPQSKDRFLFLDKRKVTEQAHQPKNT